MTTTPHDGQTVLVVDDDQAMLDLLDELLTDAGFATTCHLSGQPAMQALTQQRFDVLITDVNLPDINGLKLCDVAREQYGDHIVILAISEVDIPRRTVMTMMALQLGADDFLGKPFDLTELLARIEAKLRRLPSADAMDP